MLWLCVIWGRVYVGIGTGCSGVGAGLVPTKAYMWLWWWKWYIMLSEALSERGGRGVEELYLELMESSVFFCVRFGGVVV